MSVEFNNYVPAFNAFMNSNVDKPCKTWHDVIDVFFRLNIDEDFVALYDLAKTFTYADKPTYFLIHTNDVEQYFDRTKMSDVTLADAGFESEVNYVDDADGLRISFATFRRWLYKEGDDTLIGSFEFIDQLHQLYQRYLRDMSIRGRNNTHWLLLKRIDGFTKSMQPQIDHVAAANLIEGKEVNPAFCIMDEQPDVYCIFKGTKKSLTAKIKLVKAAPEKYQHYVDNPLKYENPKKAKSASSKKLKVPAYPKYDATVIFMGEAVLPTVGEEIEAITSYINRKRVMPFRKNQKGTINSDGDKVDSLLQTKYSIKLSKSHILIDTTTDYSVENLVRDIKRVRSDLQYGPWKSAKQSTKTVYSPNVQKMIAAHKKHMKTNNKKGSKEDVVPQVSIDHFHSTNGDQLDVGNIIASNPSSVDDLVSMFPDFLGTYDSESDIR
jgi:hypothetical protein